MLWSSLIAVTYFSDKLRDIYRLAFANNGNVQVFIFFIIYDNKFKTQPILVIFNRVAISVILR